MTEQYFQLGAILAIAMGLVEIIKALVRMMGSKNGNGLAKGLSEISSNHLTHIYDEMKEHTQQHKKIIDKNDRMIEVLIEIRTLLKK